MKLYFNCAKLHIVHSRFNPLSLTHVCPGAPFTNFNDEGGGGGDRASYFIPKNITTLEFVYPKNSLPFYAYPKKSLSPFFATQKILLFYFATQNNPGVFHRPKKITFGQNFRPKKITRTPPPPPPSLEYVSGAPGHVCHMMYC